MDYTIIIICSTEWLYFYCLALSINESQMWVLFGKDHKVTEVSLIKLYIFIISFDFVALSYFECCIPLRVTGITNRQGLV